METPYLYMVRGLYCNILSMHSQKNSAYKKLFTNFGIFSKIIVVVYKKTNGIFFLMIINKCMLQPDWRVEL